MCKIGGKQNMKLEYDEIMCQYCKDAVATNWVHSVEVCSDCFSEVYE